MIHLRPNSLFGPLFCVPWDQTRRSECVGLKDRKTLFCRRTNNYLLGSEVYVWEWFKDRFGTQIWSFNSVCHIRFSYSSFSLFTMKGGEENFISLYYKIRSLRVSSETSSKSSLSTLVNKFYVSRTRPGDLGSPPRTVRCATVLGKLDYVC